MRDVPDKAHVELFIGAVGILIKVYDVAAIFGYKRGECGDNAGAVFAGTE